MFWSTLQVQAADTLLYKLRNVQFYEDIENLAKKYIKKGSGINEAEDAAWDDRRFSLKYLIENHTEELEEYVFGDGEGEEE